MPRDNAIRFEDVSFTYEGADAPALDRVSFEVPAGATVALVGPSGGGKTTAASLVPRFWDVDSGCVTLGGVDVRAMDPHELMERVAFVFQANRPFRQTVLENVRATRPEASREEALAALEAAQCTDILEKLPRGADTLVGTGGVHLSGGEVQRLMIARAILKDAPVVVLDEATAFADPENEAKIQAAFKRLARGGDGLRRTVLMIAHRLSTVRNADLIVVLDKGRVVESGTHGELLAAGGLYARMWADYRAVRELAHRERRGGGVDEHQGEVRPHRRGREERQARRRVDGRGESRYLCGRGCDLSCHGGVCGAPHRGCAAARARALCGGARGFASSFSFLPSTRPTTTSTASSTRKAAGSASRLPSGCGGSPCRFSADATSRTLPRRS